jgi:hypothetical protein
VSFVIESWLRQRACFVLCKLPLLRNIIHTVCIYRFLTTALLRASCTISTNEPMLCNVQYAVCSQCICTLQFLLTWCYFTLRPAAGGSSFETASMQYAHTNISCVVLQTTRTYVQPMMAKQKRWKVLGVCALGKTLNAKKNLSKAVNLIFD